MWILLTFLVALGGSLLLQKIKFPGGMMVGAILGAAILNLVSQQAVVFPHAKVFAQALTGAYIGCMVTRDDMRRLPTILKPYLLVMASLLCLCMIMGTVFYALTDYDLITCLFCAAPGGVSDIPLIAMDMGADGSVVAVMQFIRMVFGVSVLPTLILLADRMIEPEVSREMDERAKTIHVTKSKKTPATMKQFLPGGLLALVVAFAGKFSGIPAAALSFPVITTTALKLTGKCPGMPPWLRQVAQVVTGCCIGITVNREQLLQLRQLLLPALLLCVGYVTCCVVMGLVVSKVFKLDLREGMLSLSPAGAGEMALIAADLGIESPNLIVLQIGRLMGVVLVFPYVIAAVAHLFG